MTRARERERGRRIAHGASASAYARSVTALRSASSLSRYCSIVAAPASARDLFWGSADERNSAERQVQRRAVPGVEVDAPAACKRYSDEWPSRYGGKPHNPFSRNAGIFGTSAVIATVYPSLSASSIATKAPTPPFRSNSHALVSRSSDRADAELLSRDRVDFGVTVARDQTLARWLDRRVAPAAPGNVGRATSRR